VIPDHLATLTAAGVITVDASGVVRLTREAWRAATDYGPYAEYPLPAQQEAGESYKALHFVGFKNDRLHSAVKVWGKPDFYHRFYDRRAVADIAPGDIVVFAGSQELVEFSFDDSQNW
jgi:hypothetical protein